MKKHYHLIAFPFLRVPSGWLSLDRSVLDYVAQTIGVGKKTESSESSSTPTPPMPGTPPTTAKARYANILRRTIQPAGGTVD